MQKEPPLAWPNARSLYASAILTAYMSPTKEHLLTHGTLALSGGGGAEDTVELDAHFFSLLPSNTKMLYIPVALERDAEGFEACEKWFSSVIALHAGNKNIRHLMLLEDAVVPDLASYDAVYIGGGNTYKLLDYIERKKLGSALRDFLRDGKAVYGGSAGAIIFGKDIRTVENENDKDYPLHKGLDMLRGRSAVCHYNENLDESIYQTAIRIEGDILALTESAGVLMQKNEERVFGEVYLFTCGGTKERYPN